MNWKRRHPLKFLMSEAGLVIRLLLISLMLCGCSGEYNRYRSDYRQLLVEVHSLENDGFLHRDGTSMEDIARAKAERDAKVKEIQRKVNVFNAKYRDKYRKFESFKQLSRVDSDITLALSAMKRAEVTPHVPYDLNETFLDSCESYRHSVSELSSTVFDIQKFLDEGKWHSTGGYAHQ